MFTNPEGSNNLGHFSVHRKTGEVWQDVPCKYLSAPSAIPIQKALRARQGLKGNELARLLAEVPCSD